MQIYNPAKPYVIIVVGNNTTHDVTQPRKTILGTLQHVERVVDADFPSEPLSTVTVNEVTSQPAGSAPSLWHPPINLSHLLAQQEMAKRMLYEESKAFANPSMQMVINLKDHIPVQRTYTSIPKLLLREVKEYIQDLLLKG